MNNFLFEDENGEYFFVECDDLEEALDIVIRIDELVGHVTVERAAAFAVEASDEINREGEG